MSLLVVLIALGLRQLGLLAEPATAMASLVRVWRDSWLTRGQREGWNSTVTLVFIVLPPVLLVAVAVVLADSLWHGIILELIALLVMMLVLLDREIPGVLQREQAAWLSTTIEPGALAQVDLHTLEVAAEAELARARRSLLAVQMHELFAPLFWFLLLGPIAVTAYYFLRIVTLVDTSPCRDRARQFLDYADWPVVRILSLSFALAGDFVVTWQYWRSHVLGSGTSAITLLDESAAVAQAVDLRMSADTDPATVLAAGLSTIAGLLHRTLVIWVVLLAVHTLWP